MIITIFYCKKRHKQINFRIYPRQQLFLSLDGTEKTQFLIHTWTVHAVSMKMHVSLLYCMQAYLTAYASSWNCMQAWNLELY